MRLRNSRSSETDCKKQIPSKGISTGTGKVVPPPSKKVKTPPSEEESISLPAEEEEKILLSTKATNITQEEVSPVAPSNGDENHLPPDEESTIDQGEESDTGSDVFMPVGMPLRTSESDLDDDKNISDKESTMEDVSENHNDGDDDGEDDDKYEIDEEGLQVDEETTKDDEEKNEEDVTDKEPSKEQKSDSAIIHEDISDDEDSLEESVLKDTKEEMKPVVSKTDEKENISEQTEKQIDSPVDKIFEDRITNELLSPEYENKSLSRKNDIPKDTYKSEIIKNIDKTKPKIDFTEDTFDEGNIFSNSDIFVENHTMGSDKKIISPKVEEKDDDEKDDNIKDDEHDEFLKGHEDVGDLKKEEDDSDDNKSEIDEKFDHPPPEEEGPDGDPPDFVNTEINIYLIDKKRSRSGKDIRRMVCECPFEPDDHLFIGCDEDCLNRLLMIECNKNCPTGEFCTNRAFQKGCIYDLQIIKAGKKGWGLKTNENITKGAFVIEYCGEVVDYTDFHLRTQSYAEEGLDHFYFMTLKTNEIIDATKKGSISRFINHSCDPNCVTQKWTANGFLRVGFFALRHIKAGEELSFDYQFQRYGEKPQVCFCGSDKCRGVIGTEQSANVPNYVEKYLSSSTTKKKGKGNKESKKQIKDFYESALAEDLKELLGDKWVLTEPTQTLELVRLMVKTETSHERRELLKIMQASADTNALKSFVRYKGLDLLWSWMIDASSESRNKYRYEILKTLKHIPIRNKNELDDSKLMNIVSKWAIPAVDSTSENVSEDEGNQSPNSDTDERKDGNSTSNDEKDDDEGGEKKKSNESMEEGEIQEDDEVGSKKQKRKNKLKKSELKKRQKESMRKRDVATLAQQLIDEWKTLKEVFRIPKKARPTDDRPTDGSDGSPLQDEKRGKDKLTTASPLQTGENWSNNFNNSNNSYGTGNGNNNNNSTTTTCSNIKQTPPDSTYSSPSAKQKQIRINKGIGSFMHRVEENELTSSSEEQSSSTFDENSDRQTTDNSYPRNRKGTKRDWHDNHNKKDASDYSEQSGTVDSTSNWSGDSSYENPNNRGGYDSGGGGRRNKRGKDRRRSYEDDRRNNKWNDHHHDDMMESDNDNMRNRNWDDNRNIRNNRNWNNNRGGRGRMNDRGDNNMGGNFDGPPDESYLSWRNRTNDYWGPGPPPPKPQPPPQPPQPPHFNDPSGIPSLMDQDFDQGHQSHPLNPHQPPHHQQQQPLHQQPHQQPHQPHQPHTPLQRPIYNPANPNSPNIPPQVGGIPPPSVLPPNMPNMICPPPYMLPPPPLPPQPINPAALNPCLNPLLPNQGHKNSTIVSPMASQSYNAISGPVPTDMNPAAAPFHHQPGIPTPNQAEVVQPVSAMSVVNQLHQLLNQERRQTPDFSRNSSNTSPVQSSPPSSPRSKPLPALPPHWKTATDADGRVYYYHSITRETSWDPPTLSDDGASLPSSPISKRNRKDTPPSKRGGRSPPSNHSPRIAAADTTHHHGPRTPPVQQTTSKVMSSAELQKIRDTFKAKMSSVVVNCLNSYQKVDCKQGRIKNIDDFKFLARKLTHGLIMKEIQRIKNEKDLICNDSVKVKVKEYIRNYMRKFGVCYIRS